MKFLDVSGIEAKVCLDIQQRQALGIAKYGQTVTDNPLSLREWLQHAYEECLDQAVYLRLAMEEIEGRAPPAESTRPGPEKTPRFPFRDAAALLRGAEIDVGGFVQRCRHIYDVSIQLEQQLRDANAGCQKLSHENEFMRQLIDRHMIGE